MQGIQTGHSGDMVCGGDKVCEGYFWINVPSSVTNYLGDKVNITQLCFGNNLNVQLSQPIVENLKLYKADKRYSENNPNRWREFNFTGNCLNVGNNSFKINATKDVYTIVKWGISSTDIDPLWLGGIDYDANMEIYSYNNMTIKAPYQIQCQWSDPKSNYKHCDVIIEVENNVTSFTTTTLPKLDFLYNAVNLTMNYSKTFTYYNDSILNRTCFGNLTDEKKFEVNNTYCYYNYTRRSFTSFLPMPSAFLFAKNSVTGIRATFDSPMTVTNGKYQRNHFNFTIFNALVNFTLDPDISDCTDMTANNSIYTLTADIVDSLALRCMNFSSDVQNTTLDCGGHNIDGKDTGSSYGVYATGVNVKNNTVQNCNITDWTYGIYIVTSSNNTFTNNTANSNTQIGFYLYSSSNNTLTNNTITSLHTSASKQQSLYIYGNSLSNFRNNISESNTINGLPILYIDGINRPCPNNTVYTNGSSYGYIGFVGCNNITVRDSSPTDHLMIGFTHNSTISNLNISFTQIAILLYGSNNIITNNTANSNTIGFYLLTSSNNIITNNTANSNNIGLYFFSSSINNTITNNTANSNSYGLYLTFSSINNTITNGSVALSITADYYLSTAGMTNNFTNTNFTAQRKIRFDDETSYFNYANDSTSNLWLKTNVSVAKTIARTLNKWSQTNMSWNDNVTATTATAKYNLTGLLANTQYSVYNGTALEYTLTTNSIGQINFTINLNTTTRYIEVSTSGDITFPTYTNNGSSITNNTTVNNGSAITYYAQWTDDITLDKCVNSSKINTSGSWTNGTWASAGAGNWTNYTIAFPAEQGSNLTVKIYCNDTSNNMNVTGTMYWWNVSNIDIIPPSITIESPLNQTYNTQTIWFNSTLNEVGSWCGYSLDYFANNNTMTNDSTTHFYYQGSGVTLGNRFVNFYCNDTSGNMNSTTQWFTVIDNTTSTYSFNQTNSTIAGTWVNHSLYWTDDISLSGYIFSFCNGSFTNASGALTTYNWTSPDQEASTLRFNQTSSTSTSTNTTYYIQTTTANITGFNTTSPSYLNAMNGGTYNLTENQSGTVAGGVTNFVSYYNFSLTSPTVTAYGQTQDTGTGSTNPDNNVLDFTKGWVGTNLTAGAYSALQISGNRANFTNVNLGNNVEPFGRFNFTIAEPITDITWIFVSMTQKEYASMTESCYYYISNFTGSAWYAFATQTSSATDVVGSLNITSRMSDYIDPVTKQLVILSWGVDIDNGEGCAVNDVNVTIGYSTTTTAPVYRAEVEHNATGVSYTGTINNITASINFTTNVTSTLNMSIYNFNTNLWNSTICNNGTATANTWYNWWCNATVNNPSYYNSSTGVIRVRLNGTSLNAQQATIREDNVNFTVSYQQTVVVPVTEQNQTWSAPYNGIDGDDYQNVDKIGVIINITSYNPSASNSTYNNNNKPDIEVSFYNGTKYNFNTTCNTNATMGNGFLNTTSWNCSINKTDTALLNAWKYQANRSVVIRGIYLDAYNTTIYDEINVTGVYGYVDGWNDTRSGGNYSCSDSSAILTNGTWASMTGIGNWSNVTKIVNSTVGSTIKWCYYANDTSNNWNGTSCATPFSYLTTSAEAGVIPTYTNFAGNVTNNTAVNTNTWINISALWTDDTELDKCTNSSIVNISTGTWYNGTWASEGTGNWTNYTIKFPAEIGSNLTVRIYCNDTSNNMGVTGTLFWYNATPSADSCTYSSGDWNIQCSDNCLLSTNTDLGANTLRFIGTGTVNVNAQITAGKVEKDKNCIVIKMDKTKGVIW